MAQREQSLRVSQDEFESASLQSLKNTRHLGLFSTALLLTNRMIGAAIFSVPSSIFSSVRSVGAAFLLWLLGPILAFCGLGIWLELGCLMPRSGGECVYLEAAFPRPYQLAATLFSFYVMFGLGGLASIVVTDNFLLAVDGTLGETEKRAMSIAVLGLVSAMLSMSRDWSIRLMNLLGLVKIVILLLIIFTALAVLLGTVDTPVVVGSNFRQPFAGSSTDFYDYTVSIFKIMATFQGWNNAAYVVDEVKNPQITLKRAGILGVGTVGLLYLAVNISFFVVATPDDLSNGGVRLVAHLLGNIFGRSASRITAALVSLSTFGSMISSAFAITRVVHELALEGVVPAASFFARTNKHGAPDTPAFLFMYGSSVVAIALLPFEDAYNFLVDATQYQMTMINCAVVIGLFIIRRKVPNSKYSFRVWTWVAGLFMAVQFYLLLTPFLSLNGRRDTSLPYWLAPIVGMLGFGFGSLYWRFRSVSQNNGYQPLRSRRGSSLVDRMEGIHVD